MSLAPFPEVDLQPFTQALLGTQEIIAKLARGVADPEKREIIANLAKALEEHRTDFLNVVPSGLQKGRSQYESNRLEYEQLLSQIQDVRGRKAKLLDELKAKIAQSPPRLLESPLPAKPSLLPEPEAPLEFDPAEDLVGELFNLGKKAAVPLDPGLRSTGNIWSDWKQDATGINDLNPDSDED